MKIVENITPNNENTRLMDSIFNNYGYGWLTWKVYIITFFIISVEGFHLTFVNNMIISLKEFYQMEDSDIQLINSLFFLAIGLGSLATGYISRYFKRIKIIITFFFIIALIHISLAFVTNLIMFALLRLLLGICHGIGVPLSLNLLTEYLPIRMRSVMITNVWLGFSFGQLINLLLMYFIMPNNEPKYFQETVMYSSILSGSVFILLLLFLNDSPRNLILIGDTSKGFEILTTLNGKELTESEQETIINESDSNTNNQLNASLTEIFKPAFRRITVLLIMLWVINSILAYGPNLIISLTMKELGIHSDDLIINQIIICLICSPSNVIGGFVSEISFLGRNKTTVFSFAIMIVFNIILLIDHSNFQFYIGTIFFLLSIAFNVNNTYSCEVYPTKVRDLAIGFLFFCTRVGGFLSQILFIEFFKIYLWMPYYVTMGLAVLGIICVLLLPYDTYARELDKDEYKKPLSETT
jgi:MFS family permease